VVVVDDVDVDVVLIVEVVVDDVDVVVVVVVGEVVVVEVVEVTGEKATTEKPEIPTPLDAPATRSSEKR
jgi:hypothetical protein